MLKIQVGAYYFAFDNESWTGNDPVFVGLLSSKMSEVRDTLCAGADPYPDSTALRVAQEALGEGNVKVEQISPQPLTQPDVIY
jgi:hypothetical protein